MMQLAEEIGVKNLEVYGDSKVIVNQVHGEYEVRHEDLVPYHIATIDLVAKFKNFYIDHVLRQQNAIQMHWRPSLLHWPFQLEPRREYSSTVVTCTVANRP